MAGIAAGRNADLSGVARDADVIAVQIFSNSETQRAAALACRARVP